MSAVRSNSGPTNEEKLAAMREYTALKRVLDEANGVLRSTLKRFKTEGHNTKALVAACAATRRDPAEVKSETMEYLRLLGLRSVISIGELLEEADNLQVSDQAREDDDIGIAEERGYRAGKFGAPVEDNPYDAGTAQHQAWGKWRDNGAKAAAKINGPNAKQADASREKPGRKPKKNVTVLALAGAKRGRKPKGGAAAVN